MFETDDVKLNKAKNDSEEVNAENSLSRQSNKKAPPEVLKQIANNERFKNIQDIFYG